MLAAHASFSRSQPRRGRGAGGTSSGKTGRMAGVLAVRPSISIATSFAVFETLRGAWATGGAAGAAAAAGAVTGGPARGAAAPPSDSSSAPASWRKARASSSRRRHSTHWATCDSTARASRSDSSPSSSAFRWPSSACDITASFPSAVRFHQATPSARQGRADRALRQAQRGGNLLVTEPFGLEQQRGAVLLGELRQREPDLGVPLRPVHRLLGRGRRVVLRLALEQLELAALPDVPPALVARQVQRDGEQPRFRIERRRLERAQEHFLRQVLRTLTVARPA